MLSPSQQYDSLIKVAGEREARETSYEYALLKYFHPDASPQAMVPVRKYHRFIPGNIYTFEYSPVTRASLDFFDRRPVVLSLRTWMPKGTTNQIEQCLNLNLLPPKVRVQCLESIYRMYSGIVDSNYRSLSKDVYSGIKPLFPSDPEVMWKLLTAILENVRKINFHFAIRNYYFRQMKGPKIIEFSDWGAVCHLETKDLVGVSLPKVYSMYWEQWRERSNKTPVKKKRH